MFKMNNWLVILVILPDFDIVFGEPLRRLYNNRKTERLINPKEKQCDVYSDCVPFERCKSSCDKIFESSVIQRLKYLLRVQCDGGRGGEGKLHVCCQKQNVLDFTYCSENDDAKELEHAKAAQTKLNKDYSLCGTENFDFRLVYAGDYDEPAPAHHLQWNAILRDKRKEGSVCSAVLLTRKHLVSAAHCLKKSTEYEVIFSLNSIQSFQQCVQSSDCRSSGCRTELDRKCVKFKIIEVIKHPRHDNTKTVSNFDIAILTIDREVDLIPICLPDLDSFRDLEVSEKVIVAAWSNNSEKTLSEEFDLVQGNFSHATNEKCFKEFNINVSVLQMCIESTGSVEDKAYICQGDSGAGALREKANGGLEIVGITTAGSTSCVASDQTIFTRISGPILRWVLNQLYQHDIR